MCIRDRSGTHHAEMILKDYGTIKMELDADTAPLTVTNFVKLVQEDFYDGLTFHRIVNDFMMQGGDPEGNGTGEMCIRDRMNGSGKTVLLKCICGFLHPSEGKILVEGKWIGKETDFPESLGMIIENPGFLPNLSGRDNLKILASLRGTIGKKEIETAMEKVGLDFSSKKPVKNYSLGMRERLGIAQAIMEDPHIIILDEPFNGLDKNGVQEVYRIDVYKRQD